MVVINKLDAIGCGTAAVALSRAFPALVQRWTKLAAVAGLVLLAECYVFSSRYTFLDHVALGESWLGRVVLPSLVPFAWTLLLFSAAQKTQIGSAWTDRIVAATARWSYGLYLINLPILAAVLALVNAPLEEGWGGGLVGLFFFLLLSFVGAAALHRWFERPIMNLRGRIPWCRLTLAARTPRQPSGA